MKKLGKSAKGCLISGISIALVGAGLYIFNITGTISIVCIVTGTMCALVGTPYINGIEYPQMIKEQQLQHRIELANKKNYVESNLHKYGIGKEQSKQEKTWDDALYTEEEIHKYMQMPESPAPFNPETIFGGNDNIEEQNEKITDFRTSIPSSRRFPGYEETQVRCAYSSPTNYKSTRTERDNTKKPGVLYRDLECDDQTKCLQQEQSGPVLTKKLTPPKHTEK